ncbi:MAG: Holliday junction branch migration protein RuvA [Paludibacteraceae bacterium]|nr:Holliday junction branch migration protein RuvA [Paludibacteraceae bacterium]
MIDYIKGTITELTPTSVVLETGGIGYFINISLTTYSSLNKKEDAHLFVYEAIREDAHLLFGFMNRSERQLFLLLISVPGIGANTARVIMSSYSASEIQQMIAGGDVVSLNTIKGIGTKTAQRIIVDLKDKILKISDTDGSLPKGSTLGAGSNTLREETVAALTMLGFAAVASQKVVEKIIRENASLTVEQVIKQALKML